MAWSPSRARARLIMYKVVEYPLNHSVKGDFSLDFMRVKSSNWRLFFDKRTIAFRQTLVCPSTNARLGLDKRSFVPRLPIVCERSNGGSFFVVQSRGTPVLIEGIPRCFLGGVAMLSRESADAIDGIPSMVIRDPFDGYARCPWWKSAHDWWESESVLVRYAVPSCQEASLFLSVVM